MFPYPPPITDPDAAATEEFMALNRLVPPGEFGAEPSILPGFFECFFLLWWSFLLHLELWSWCIRAFDSSMFFISSGWLNSPQDPVCFLCPYIYIYIYIYYFISGSTTLGLQIQYLISWLYK